MPWGRIAFNYLLNQKFPTETCDMQLLRTEAGECKKLSVKARRCLKGFLSTFRFFKWTFSIF